MRPRFILLLSVGAISACSSSDFSLSDGSDAANDTATVSTDTGTTTEDSGTIEPGPDAVAEAAPGCVPADHSSTALFVDASALPGGTGSAGCPFRTLAEAANAPLGAGVSRVVSVHTGTYVEAATIKIRKGETYRADGSGLVKVSGNATAACASGDSCTFQLDTGATIDGILVEGGTAANGIVAAGTSGTGPVIKNTTVKAAVKDGIVVLGVGALLGPNTHADFNGWSGMVVRAGKASVNGVSNSFNGNKGGFYIGSSYVAGSGIHVRSGASLFVDGGTQANNNANGVFFDAGGTSGTQVISQLTAISNRGIGVHVPKGWQVQFRKSYLNKNGSYGLFASFDSTTSIDLGASGSPGGNTFGSASSKNGKAGIFLCRSGKTGSLPAESNTWGSCPPTQGSVANCDTAPTSYVDVAYVPEFVGSEYDSPLAAPTVCGSS